jgi:hypothetical protein
MRLLSIYRHEAMEAIGVPTLFLPLLGRKTGGFGLFSLSFFKFGNS